MLLPSSFKTGILPRPGKAKVKNSHQPPLKYPVCSLRGTLTCGSGNFFLPCQAGLCRDENCTAVWKASACPMPCPCEGCLGSQSYWLWNDQFSFKGRVRAQHFMLGQDLGGSKQMWPSALPSATLGKHPFTDLYQLPARAASADGSDFLLGSEMLPQHGRERIVLSRDGTSFPATPAVISVFFIDRPQNTLQKKYHCLPDKEAGAGKVLCLGHQADQ